MQPVCEENALNDNFSSVWSEKYFSTFSAWFSSIWGLTGPPLLCDVVTLQSSVVYWYMTGELPPAVYLGDPTNICITVVEGNALQGFLRIRLKFLLYLL